MGSNTRQSQQRNSSLAPLGDLAREGMAGGLARCKESGFRFPWKIDEHEVRFRVEIVLA
jgi:hypothetical protein